MSLRYYFKIKSHLNNRAYQQIIPPTDRLLFCNKQMTPPFGIRTRISIEKLSIVQTPVLPEFLSRILNITIPTWHTISPEINVELSEYTKGGTNPALSLQEFQRVVGEKFQNHLLIYTDCCNCAPGVGSAAVCNGNSKRATLPKIASVFSAELHAIQLAHYGAW